MLQRNASTQAGRVQSADGSQIYENHYFRDIYFWSACPQMLLDFGVPLFMRENWGHRLSLSCSAISDLPTLMLGLQGTGSNPHLDSMRAEAYSTQLHGKKSWILGDHRDLIRGDFSGLCVHVQTPGTTVYIPRLWVHDVLNVEDSISVQGDFLNAASVVDMTLGENDQEDSPSTRRECVEFFRRSHLKQLTQATSKHERASELNRRCKSSKACISVREGTTVQHGLIHPITCDLLLAHSAQWQKWAKEHQNTKLLSSLNCNERIIDTSEDTQEMMNDYPSGVFGFYIP
jgi:hypothetical protein